MTANPTNVPPDVAAMREEHDRMRAEIEELRRIAAEANRQFDPNRPLRDFTAPDPETIHLGYPRPNIGHPYQIPPGWMAMFNKTNSMGMHMKMQCNIS